MNKYNQRKINSLIIVMFIIVTYLFLRTSYVFPDKIMLIEGKEYTYDFNTPLNVGIIADKQGAIKLNGNQIDNSSKISLNKPIKIQSDKLGNVNLKFKLFGAIPIRTITVNVIPKSVVVPCGNTIGVKIQTKGLLVVGTSKVTGIDGKEYKPFKDANIRQGDLILAANSKEINKITDFTNIISNSNGQAINLTVERDSVIKEVNITPIKCIDNNNYKLGLWVRDSTSGIGTMTFYDPNTKSFAALGHGIMDIDTGSLLTVNKGEILESNIISVKKGEKGNPGELKGVFIASKSRGTIIKNTDYGIYGKLESTLGISNNKVIPLALRDEVKEGPAKILSNVSGKDVEEFDIEIQKVLRNNYTTSKNMIIRITDERLINMTGGIVQGMSGSPIIQDGKLVGAVTHVFINDSTRGYGIFSELMFQSINNLDKK